MPTMKHKVIANVVVSIYSGPNAYYLGSRAILKTSLCL